MKPKLKDIGTIAIIVYIVCLLVLLIIATSCSTTHGTLDTKDDTFYYSARKLSVDTIYCEDDKIHITLSK